MRIVQLGAVPSTQEAARGLPVGTAVVAQFQSAGRGRLDRRWEAPWGSALLATFVFPPRSLALFRAGIAAARACGPGVRLKWPNDVLLEGRKVGGLLAEQHAGRCLVGMGINLSWSPPGAARLGVPREDLLGDLIPSLEEWWSRADADILEEWRQRSDTLGRTVRVELPNEIIEGAAEALDPDGALVVGGRRVVVGDVVYLRATARDPEHV